MNKHRKAECGENTPCVADLIWSAGKYHQIRHHSLPEASGIKGAGREGGYGNL